MTIRTERVNKGVDFVDFQFGSNTGCISVSVELPALCCEIIKRFASYELYFLQLLLYIVQEIQTYKSAGIHSNIQHPSTIFKMIKPLK